MNTSLKDRALIKILPRKRDFARRKSLLPDGRNGLPCPLSQVSDIDRYFDTARVSVTDTSDPVWLCNWWRLHRDEFPQMAEAARG